MRTMGIRIRIAITRICVDFSVRDDRFEPRRVVLRVLLGWKAPNVPRRLVQRQLDGGLGRGIALFTLKTVLPAHLLHRLITGDQINLFLAPESSFLLRIGYLLISDRCREKQLKAEFILIIIYLQANMNVESLLTQFLSVQKKTNTSHVMEYGDKVWLLRNWIWCISRQNRSSK